jgi:hypothetical protein
MFGKLNKPTARSAVPPLTLESVAVLVRENPKVDLPPLTGSTAVWAIGVNATISAVLNIAKVALNRVE